MVVWVVSCRPLLGGTILTTFTSAASQRLFVMDGECMWFLA